MSATISKERLQELLAKARAGAAQRQAAAATVTQPIATTQPNTVVEVIDTTNHDTISAHAVGMHGEAITYNAKQLQAVQLIGSGESCVILGPAGTGKSTCQRGGVQALIQSGRAGILNADGHKHLRDGTPGIVVVAFTRRAVNNIRKVMPVDMRDNCITIHKLLEYEPVRKEVFDAETGKEKTVQVFEPTRNAIRKLPRSIHTIIVEESSMVGTDLKKMLDDALGHEVQWVFLGDIQQLPPVFGQAVLGYKMLELPVVELTEVYRQALESPIIRLAHRILSGKVITEDEFDSLNVPNKLKLHPWKKKLSQDMCILTLAKFFSTSYDKGEYNPDEDMVLIPFNKAVGTDEFNKYIAQHLGATRHALVYEIIAGFNKHYYAVGDKVMYEKEDAVITAIKVNGSYHGTKYRAPSHYLDRWGNMRDDGSNGAAVAHSMENDAVDDIDALLDGIITDTEEDRTLSASHVITIKLQDSGQEVDISTSSKINALSLGYAITVHKSQGSEARKVYVLLHHSHNTMLSRELLYTAVTRAREELYVICEKDSFEVGIKKQRIRGNTLAEKAEFFKGKKPAHEVMASMLKRKD